MTYTAITEVVVTSGMAESAEYDFGGPFVSGSITILPGTTPIVLTNSLVGPDVLVITFIPEPVGVYPLDFTFLSPDPNLAIPNPYIDTSVDGTGYIIMVSLTAVPEPSSLVLLSIGAVLGPTAYAWRRRKQGREKRFPASGHLAKSAIRREVRPRNEHHPKVGESDRVAEWDPPFHRIVPRSTASRVDGYGEGQGCQTATFSAFSHSGLTPSRK